MFTRAPLSARLRAEFLPENRTYRPPGRGISALSAHLPRRQVASHSTVGLRLASCCYLPGRVASELVCDKPSGKRTETSHTNFCAPRFLLLSAWGCSSAATAGGESGHWAGPKRPSLIDSIRETAASRPWLFPDLGGLDRRWRARGGRQAHDVRYGHRRGPQRAAFRRGQRPGGAGQDRHLLPAEDDRRARVY